MRDRSNNYNDYDLSAEDQRRLAENFENMVATGDITRPIVLEDSDDGSDNLTSDAVDPELAQFINDQIEGCGEDNFFSTTSDVLDQFNEDMVDAISELANEEGPTTVFIHNETVIEKITPVSGRGKDSNITETFDDESTSVREIFINVDYKRNLCVMSDGIQFITFSTENLVSLANEQAILCETPDIIQSILLVCFSSLYPAAQFPREELMNNISMLVSEFNPDKFMIFNSISEPNLYNTFFMSGEVKAKLDEAVDHFRTMDCGISFACAMLLAVTAAGYRNASRLTLDEDDDKYTEYQNMLLRDSATKYKNVPDTKDFGEAIPFTHTIDYLWDELNNVSEICLLLNPPEFRESEDDYDEEETDEDIPYVDTTLSDAGTESYTDSSDEEPQGYIEDEPDGIDIFDNNGSENDEDEPGSEEGMDGVEVEITHTETNAKIVIPTSQDSENYTIKPSRRK